MRFPKSYLLLLALILLAFLLRVYHLDYFSLRGDESFTVLFVQKPLAQMWYETLTVEPNPPLLYFLLRWWIDLAGASEFITRYFSLFFGVLCIPLIYRVSRYFLSSSLITSRSLANHPSSFIPYLAAFLIAINPYQIWHSQDVRNYTMWPALSLLALLFFWRWYSSNEPRAHNVPRTRRGAPFQAGFWRRSPALIFFTLAELAALYTHYYEAFILLALNLFVFATTFRDLKKLAPWIISQIILAILYLPYPLILSNRVSAYGEGSGRAGVALWDIARETFTTFTLSDTLDENLRAWLWIPFALLALVGLIALFIRNRNRGLFFLIYLAVPTVAVYALNTLRPLYLERYLNGIAPLYYLLIAVGMSTLAQNLSALLSKPSTPNLQPSTQAVLWRINLCRSSFVFRLSSLLLLLAATLAAYLALSNYWTNPAYAKAPDWRGLTNIINANAQPGDLIVQNFPETSLIYYDKTKLPLVVYPETYLPDTKTNQQLNAMNSNYQRVWFIPAAPDVWDPDEYVQSVLDRRADLLQAWDIDTFRLQLFATPSQFLNTMHPTDALFGKTFRLAGYRTTLRGNDLSLALYWRVAETPTKNVEMDIQVIQKDNTVLATQRRIPVRGTLPTTEWRKNQLIVDQYEFSNVPAASDVLLQVCNAESDTCLSLGKNAATPFATLPIQP